MKKNLVILSFLLLILNFCSTSNNNNNATDDVTTNDVTTNDVTTNDVTTNDVINTDDVSNDTACLPVCDSEGWECGDDGCNGSCGTCDNGSECKDHKCVVCDCGTKECGTDDCGNACGTNNGDCPEGSVCDADGMCQACTPQCQGKECGPDGCGSTCGECSTGSSCVAGTCQQQTAKSPFGGACGPNDDCQPPSQDLPKADYDTAQQAYFDCLNAQCDGDQALCWNPYCTKRCAIHKDSVNNITGEAVPDGIEDADTSVNDCLGAVDGPIGSKFTCVNIAPEGSQPQGICYAGSLKPCNSQNDCVAGESCGFIYIKSAYQKRCQTTLKNSTNDIGATCNDNPKDGDVAFCGDNFCFSLGCSGFCEDGSNCLTAGSKCENGKCSENTDLACTTDADCSSWECSMNQQLDSGGTWVENICYPKNCTKEYSCPDPDFFCRPLIDQDETTKAYKVSGFCTEKMADSVDLGEACDSNPFDNIPGDPCVNPYFCLDGYCGGMCESDADCATDKGQMCGVAFEYNYDADGDNVDDAYLVFPSCLTFNYAGGDKSCEVSADCDNGECKYYESGTGAGQYTYSGKCVDSDANKAKVGEFCGDAAGGATCDSGWCLSLYEPNIPAFCSQVCNSTASCPTTLNLGGTEVKTFCRSLLVGWNGTKDPNDDLYAPLCLIADSSESLADCSADYSSCADGESCVPNPIGTSPDKAAKVEYLCRSYGQATKEAGEECNPNPTQDDDPTLGCKDVYCLPDTTKDKGYCSKLCKTNDDCPEGLVCADYQLLPRKDASKAAITKLCQKQASCIPCTYDYTCPANYTCANVGGLGFTVDYRCVPSCAADADCQGTDGGDKCVESKDKDGNGEGKSACIPASGTCK